MSVANPVVQTWDGSARKIHLKAGVTALHWVDDIYAEYIHQRRVDEAFRVWLPLLKADGNVPKGGGKYTPRYVTLLNGAKVVPYDEVATITVTGEGITDDTSDPFETTGRTHPLRLNIEPPAAEVIKVSGGSGLDEEQDAILRQALTAATAAKDQATKARKMQTNKAVVSGDGQSVVLYEDDGATLMHTFTISGDKKARVPT